jgi:hypothetical protein
VRPAARLSPPPLTHTYTGTASKLPWP